MVIVSSVFVLTCSCLLFTTQTNNADVIPEEAANVELWKLVVTAYGIVAFQFDIHPSILTIQMDMTKKSKLTSAIAGGFLGLFFF